MAGTRQVALIRGINVGRAKRVAMADLRAMLERFGYSRVRTLLNSGNAVFAGSDPPAASAKRIERGLADQLEVEARVVVLTAAQLAKVVDENPLLERLRDPSRFLVAVPLVRAELAKLRPLLREPWKRDALGVGSHAAYLACPSGFLDSPLAKAVNRTLADAVTTRNWATILKLRELLEAPE